jgi:putative selenate reductase
MSDTMKIQRFSVLLKWILKELEENESVFGIHRSLFYIPQPDAPFATENMFGHHLATPIGPAAGPHTQLAQNIVCAWLSGGRFIELKTVQIMDDLEIPRPCIDMEDEGYNVEWSQELRLDESAHEYVNAWALIHILRRVLSFEGKVPFGTIFNMSVGYNLEGIQSPPMVRFVDRMLDASTELDAIRDTLGREFPQFADLEIPSQLTNSVTLSTMHGCPPDEIEAICRYMLEERALHTYVKLNPTLLGRETVLRILHDEMGYREIQIPEAVFAHDLRYERAVPMIKALKATAAEKGLVFGAKLSNTLAMANHRQELPGDEMYMSGRALYPLTMTLFQKLSQEFDGDLNVSYAGGADAVNAPEILAAGALPVTSASDLLKPGGYSRFLQYLENLEAAMRDQGACSVVEFAGDKQANLERAAAAAIRAPRYKKSYFRYGLPKVASGLGLFDCVVAPCKEQCAVCQDVPEYAWLISQGEYDRALGVILARNPLPGVTGHVCTELCRTRCTRNDYEEPVAIRALKRFAAAHGKVQIPNPQSRPTKHRVAVVGAGPAGLSAAYFLALNGIAVTVFEAKDTVGGMMRMVPVFRLPWEIIQQDVDRITDLGVEIELSKRISQPPEALLQQGYEAVYVASGFQRDTMLHIEGIADLEAPARGVFAALDLLERVRGGEQPDLGSKALVIGGGDTAMDATRVAQRLTGNPATIIYRRTQHEMPASEEELEGAFEEGNILLELASPSKVLLEAGRVVGLECLRNELGKPDESGRRRPVPIEGSEFRIKADSVIMAIGQSPDIAFLDGSKVSLHNWGAIQVDPETGLAGVPGVYAGGDIVDGPESIIAACADGRRAAEAICDRFGTPFEPLASQPASLSEQEITDVKRMRARREAPHRPEMIPVERRHGFELIEATLAKDAAHAEALRCVQCSAFCDKCVEVCPNRANFAYQVSPVSLEVPLLACRNGDLAVVGKETFTVRQARQIIHVDDFCNECGNCATFCVHHGKPYVEKPRLFLHKGDFDQEEDNAFCIERGEDTGTIWRRAGGQESRLWVQNGTLIFENDALSITLSPGWVVNRTSLKAPFSGELSLAGAAEMAMIYSGIKNSVPFLVGGG